MNKRKIALALPLFALVSCGSNRVVADREKVQASAEEAVAAYAQLTELPFASLSFRSINHIEEATYITIFGISFEEESFYSSTTIIGEEAEQLQILYGGYEEEEEEEEGAEPLYYVVKSEDGEEYERIEGVAAYALYEEASSQANLYLTSSALYLDFGLRFLAHVDDLEGIVEAQYEEEAEIAEGDLYLDVLGETYYTYPEGFGFGLSYAFGEVLSVEESEEEELLVELDEESESYEAHAIAMNFEEVEEVPLITRYAAGDGNRLAAQFDYSYGDPTAEEE